MAGRRRGGGDLGDINPKAQAATQGVKALGNAFGDLSKKGELSASSINQFAGAAANINPILGLLTAAVGATVASFKMLEELDLKDSLMGFGVGARDAVQSFELLAAKGQASVGASGELGAALEDLAAKEYFLRDSIASVSVKAAELNKKIEEEAITADEAAASLKSYADQEAAALPDRLATIEALREKVKLLRDEEAANKRAAEAEKRWQKSHGDAQRAEEAFRQARIDGGVLNDGGLVDQIEQETRARDDLRKEIEHSMETQGHATSTQLEMLAFHERNISLLEQQQRSYETLGQMAAAALGGIAAHAFDQYADAMDRVIDGHNAFNKSSGRALQNATSQIIRQVGREAAVYAIMETAKGIAASTGPAGLAAFGDPSGHFAAAATFAAVAAAAGVGAGALSVKAGGGGKGSSDGSGRDKGSGNGSATNVQVVFIGGEPDYEGKQKFATWVGQVFAGGG